MRLTEQRHLTPGALPVPLRKTEELGTGWQEGRKRGSETQRARVEKKKQDDKKVALNAGRGKSHFCDAHATRSWD